MVRCLLHCCRPYTRRTLTLRVPDLAITLLLRSSHGYIPRTLPSQSSEGHVSHAVASLTALLGTSWTSVYTARSALAVGYLTKVKSLNVVDVRSLHYHRVGPSLRRLRFQLVLQKERRKRANIMWLQGTVVLVSQIRDHTSIVGRMLA